MARIFLSYRRDDSGGYVGRLYDRFSQHFGHDHLFIDVDNIPLGHDFVEVIQNEVGSCDVLLAVIGRQWLTSTDHQGQRRLDNPEDFVYLEILTALERRIPVIPVLVGGASMPRPAELPDVLQPLARRQALVVGDRFHPDVNRLIVALELVLGAASSASASSPAPHIALEPTFSNSIGMEFVLIPAGTFMMGSPDSDTEARDDEKPAHRVTISQPFYLGKYPVTQAQWEAVMGNNPSQFKGHPTQPAGGVSWDDALAFLHKLNEREGGGDYCLPTEAQWEYACRAGTETPRYHSDVNAIAWYKENSKKRLQPVGQKLPNAWGLYDMLGNVSEWCHDGRRKYTADAAVDPMGPTSASTFRVFRGGGWYLHARGVRAANRNRMRPGLSFDYLGFRCARSGRRR